MFAITLRWYFSVFKQNEQCDYEFWLIAGAGDTQKKNNQSVFWNVPGISVIYDDLIIHWLISQWIQKTYITGYSGVFS